MTHLDSALAPTISERVEAAYQRGVTGVPTFEYDGYRARGGFHRSGYAG